MQSKKYKKKRLKSVKLTVKIQLVILSLKWEFKW